MRRVIQTLGFGLYLWLFFYVSWPYAKIFSARVLSNKEWLPAEIFLWLDPLVGLSTSLADRWWNAALVGTAATLLVCVFFPRAFCGYVCPLGTSIDIFDRLIGRRLRVLRIHVQQTAAWPRLGAPASLPVQGTCSLAGKNAGAPRRGWWVDLRYYLLAASLVGSLFGVLLPGLVAAIPVLTRGLLFTAGQLQLGLMKNWSMVPSATPGVYFSLVLLAGIFLLSLVGPRFWCRYVCPSGALASLPSLLGLRRRQVEARCIHCGQCLTVCPFDAIAPDFTTRTLECAGCQTCVGVCPEQAIHFISGTVAKKNPQKSSSVRPSVSRRQLMVAGVGGAVTALAVRAVPMKSSRPLRPPGSVAEARFLDLCIRCEQCLKVCPGPVLQAAGLKFGLEALWTPVAVFEHAGCHQECNFCTQVCPTGAIQSLDLVTKRRTRIGLAILDPNSCLPHRGERDCQLCFDECNAAGYRAIEMRTVKLPVGSIPEGTFSPDEIEAMSSIIVPVVKADACIGCGLCEYRCHSANVRQKKRLARSAIVVRSDQSVSEKS